MADIDSLVVKFAADMSALTAGFEAAVNTINAGVRKIEQTGRDVTVIDTPKVARDASAAVESIDTVVRALQTLGYQAKQVGPATIQVPTAQLAAATDLAAKLNANLTITDQKMQAAAAGAQQVARQAEQAERATQGQAAATERLARSARDAAAAATTTTTAMSRTGGVIDDTTGRFTTLGRRGAQTFVALSFAAEQFAEGSEGGFRRAARSLASFGLFFGEPGLIISGVALTGLAIVDLFEKSRKEMEKTTAAFYTNLNQMRDAANVGGLGTLQQQLFSGRTEFDKTGQLVTTPGIQQLQQQVATAERLRDQAQAIAVEQRALFESTDPGVHANTRVMQDAETAFQRQVQIIATLRPQLEELERRYTAVAAATKAAVATSVDQTTIGFQIDADNKRANAAERAREREARAQEEAAKRQVAALTRIAEAGDAAALALAGDRLVTGGRGGATLGGIGTAAFDTALKALVKDIDAARTATTATPFEVRLKLFTTREELERQILAAMPPDNVFQVRVDAQLRGVTTDLRNLLPPGTTGQAERSQFLLPDFQPGGRFDTQEKFLHTTSDTFAAVASDSELVARAFANLPGLADSFVVRLLSATSSGFSGAATFGRSVDAIGTAGSTLESFSAVAGLASGALGVVGAIGSLVGAFTGMSAQEQELRAIQRSNIDALEQNTLALSFRNDSDTLQRAGLAAARVATVAGPIAQFEALGADPAARSIVNQILAASHTTFAELERIAKSEGLTLVDRQGNLVASAFDTLAQSIGVTIQSLTKLDDSFQAQLSRTDLTANVLNLPTDTASTIARQFKVFQDTAPKLAQQFFAGITDDVLKTKAGQAEFEADLQRFYKAVAAGLIDPTKLGGLSGVSDLTPFFQGEADSLDALRKATDAATQSMLNVPQGFRLFAEQFAAQMPDAAAPIGDPGTRTPDPVNPWGRSAPTTTTVTHQWTVHIDTVTTQARTGDELADQLTNVVLQRASASSGDGRQALTTWGRAMRTR